MSKICVKNGNSGFSFYRFEGAGGENFVEEKNFLKIDS